MEVKIFSVGLTPFHTIIPYIVTPEVYIITTLKAPFEFPHH